MYVCVADLVGPRTVVEHVEQPAIRLVPVPLAGHVAHVLQPGDLLLDEHALPSRFRSRVAQRARVRPVHGRLSEGATTPVPSLQQPQRRQPSGRPATDQHVVVVRVGQVAAQVVQRAARDIRSELQTELERGNSLNRTSGRKLRIHDRAAFENRTLYQFGVYSETSEYRTLSGAPKCGSPLGGPC